MQSFLITAKDKNTASSYIANLLKERKVNSLDINLQVYEKAMGITDVRNIQRQILLKPFRGKTKAIIIDACGNITPEAQNALLKILEEPPANTLIVITTAKKETVLPTIISRCKVVVLREKEIKLTEDDLSEFRSILNILLNGTTGDKLKIAQDITKNKENATLWLEKMAVFIRTKLVENYNNPTYLGLLKQLQKIYTIINNTNVSKRVAFENFFISL